MVVPLADPFSFMGLVSSAKSPLLLAGSSQPGTATCVTPVAAGLQCFNAQSYHRQLAELNRMRSWNMDLQGGREMCFFLLICTYSLQHEIL